MQQKDIICNDEQQKDKKGKRTPSIRAFDKSTKIWIQKKQRSTTKEVSNMK